MLNPVLMGRVLFQGDFHRHQDLSATDFQRVKIFYTRQFLICFSFMKFDFLCASHVDLVFIFWDVFLHPGFFLSGCLSQFTTDER